jgi:hypothetical protein
MSRKPVIVAFIILQAGWSAVQAFGFCFNFGGGSNNRADFYNRPPPAVGFGPGVYNYPYSPVVPTPLYMPYYPPPPAQGYYESRMPEPVENE